MSELEDEGVRAILRRLDALEPVVKRLEEAVQSISRNGACWTYVVDGDLCSPKLAGQDFANTTRDIREDMAELRGQLGLKRFDGWGNVLGPLITDLEKAR